MSTKTSIKRIALVAVSALGFGVLSMVPASAATTSAALVSKPAVTRAGAAVTLQIVGERIGDADANGQWISQATAVPAGAGIELNDKMVNAEADSDSGEDKTMTLGRAAGSIGIIAEKSADGTAECRTIAQLIADAVTSVGADSTAPTLLSQIYWANDGTAYVYADDQANAGAAKAWVKVDGAAYEYTGNATGGTTGDACSLETDTNVGFDAGSYAAGASATITFGALNVSVANRTYSATGDYFSVAGDYTFRTWWEEDNDQILDGDEKYFDATVSLGGTPASFTLTPVQTSQVAAVNIEIRVAVLDSGNRPTTLSGAEEIIVVPTTLTGTNDDKFDDDSDASNGSTSSESFTGADTVVAGKAYYLGAAHKATAGTMSLSANFTGALLALATPVASGTS